MNIIHVAPFVVYLLGTQFIGRFGDDWYPLLYAVLVAGLCIWLPVLYSGKSVLKPHGRVGLGLLVGVVGIVLWIWLSSLEIESQLTAFLPSWLRPEARVGYNPFDRLSGTAVWGFIAVRMVGIAVIVPLVEELFWRSFLLRWLVDPEWERVPLGEFTASSFLTVTLMFTLAHPEWLAAAVYCVLLNGLLVWKKDLWQCVVAHATSNLLLAVYVLNTKEWQLW